MTPILSTQGPPGDARVISPIRNNAQIERAACARLNETCDGRAVGHPAQQ